MKTITIAHSKGGVGKSTLAWNIAIAAQQLGHSVIMVDLDIQHTITHTNTARWNSQRYESMEVHSPQTIDELSKLLEFKAQLDPIVIIDVGGYDFDLGRAAIAMSDRIVVPISDSPTELYGFITFTQFLEEIKTIATVPPLTAVINNVHPRASRFTSIKSIVALWSGAGIADSIIRRRMVYAASMGNGFGATEVEEKFPQAAAEIYELTKEVIHGTL